ncbi:wd-repeat protein interacting with phosphoinosides wipi -related [Anaeramoeba flamelloides]|uniref:Wd-repeat protein interacting with phosphoinosides wipi -related n=1 Tax=Anaeramoeba flamelloides TaxID=1746091 RepID=A0ABQ8YBS7_9EUKA|nr:wd-repeat protein interacting with phosphoinosides wipi -related [Anaeramoeba flamelloides]
MTDLVAISFNSKKNCLLCSRKQGFKVFDLSPFQKRFNRKFTEYGIKMIDQLGESNLFAIVRMTNPKKLYIWDDYQSKNLAEITFRQPIRVVRMFIDKLVVCCITEVVFYRFSDLEREKVIKTGRNNPNLFATTSNRNTLQTLVVSHTEPGYLLRFVFSKNPSSNNFKTFNQKPINLLQLSHNGRLVSVCTSESNLVRVFECSSGICISQLQAGKKRTTISSMVFQDLGNYIAVVTSRSFLHIFDIPRDIKQLKTKTKEKMGVTFCKIAFQKRKPIASCQIPTIPKMKLLFLAQNITIYSLNGKIYEFKYDPQNKEIISIGKPKQFMK